jgi:hypothetical protein
LAMTMSRRPSSENPRRRPAAWRLGLPAFTAAESAAEQREPPS